MNHDPTPIECIQVARGVLGLIDGTPFQESIRKMLDELKRIEVVLLSKEYQDASNSK